MATTTAQRPLQAFFDCTAREVACVLDGCVLVNCHASAGLIFRFATVSPQATTRSLPALVAALLQWWQPPRGGGLNRIG